jgi:hypothetical protein
VQGIAGFRERGELLHQRFDLLIAVLVNLAQAIPFPGILFCGPAFWCVLAHDGQAVRPPCAAARIHRHSLMSIDSGNAETSFDDWL